MASGQGYQQFKNDPAPAYPAQPTGTYSTPYYGATVVPVQQQQQPTVIIAASPSQSFTAQILLACFTFWCCGWVFGLVAFIFAMMAQDKAQSDPVGAQSLGRVSVVISVVGIVVGIVVIIVIAVIFGTAASNVCRYYVNGMCFRYRSISYSSITCHNAHTGTTYWDGTYCYYNY